jgi:hypothetical protein
MSHEEPTLKDIADMLAILKPEQIAAIMKNIPVNRQPIIKIDYSARIKRLAINETYFSSAICPHQVANFDEYKEHDEGIRQQALSGVDSKWLVLV